MAEESKVPPEELEGWQDDVLNMIVGTLLAVGCRHEEADPRNIPPMMYDDWIRCAVGKREDRIATLEAENAVLREEQQRFTWLAEQLDFDVKIGDADPEAFITEDGDPVAAWRKAIDCAIGLGKAESHE